MIEDLSGHDAIGNTRAGAGFRHAGVHESPSS